MNIPTGVNGFRRGYFLLQENRINGYNFFHRISLCFVQKLV